MRRGNSQTARAVAAEKQLPCLMGHRLAVRERPAGKDRKIGFVLRVAHRSVSDQFDVGFSRHPGESLAGPVVGRMRP